MSVTRHHNDWLRLVPNSGPFLSLPVLTTAFPQELDAHDPEHARRLRQAFDEWDDDNSLHRQWVRFVLGETLGFEELLAEGQAIPQSLKSEEAQYGETLRPDWIVTDPATKKVRLLVQVFPRSQSLTKPVVTSRWKTSPDTRLTQLLTGTGIRLGLVTNGLEWMLVNAPKNEPAGYATWRADLWQEEQITLRAFRTLLSADRFFSVPDKETLDLKDGLLDQSQNDQQEVTDQLGYQVRKAVEVLIQALDKADQDHGRKLLGDVDEKNLYESALTVMMRLVFLFCAEERELLLLGDELYDKNYAVSTLREQLRLTADEYGEEILGLRFDAWIRLLTTFRAVYAGVKHDRLKLPAYGGSLFNPDRFSFLEGRQPDTSWKTTEAAPLPVSNRTVLHLLEALQVLQTKVGKTTEARSLSFRSLGIEQIGHVYEGLLDHTAKRATEPMLGLAGTRDQEPELALAELEKIATKGEKELLKFLKDQTGRSEPALKKSLAPELDDQITSRFRTACQDSELWKRVKPFAGLVRLDTLGYPVVVTTDSVFVTAGNDRRSTGTHYTPKVLAEHIVEHTLQPLVFDGPADGVPKEQWKLRSAKDILDLKVCDIACGSGAFLVQACRYLSERLMEAWDAEEKIAQPQTQQTLFGDAPAKHPECVRITPYGLPSQGGLFEQLVPLDPDERLTYALRIVAQRCIYGVDKNPLATEMAKLSLWLLTLAKDKPFEFLDHSVRCGDSLVGITNTEQLLKFNLDGKGEDNRLFLHFLHERVNEAIVSRRKIEEMQVNTVEDVENQDRILRETNEKLDRLKCAADMLIAAEFTPGSAADKRDVRDQAAIRVTANFHQTDLATFRREAQQALRGQTTFHWPLEFPEVIVDRNGFDAIIGNPPFMGGQKITGAFGDPYREYLVGHLANGKRGSADICAYFFIRGVDMLRDHGQLGSLATNTIAQGDTREVGLDQLLDGTCVIPRAVRSRPWPGVASLEIALVWVRKGKWASLFVLDEQETTGITAFLTTPGTVTGNPFRLKANEGKSFQGSNVLGMGFVLTPDEAKSLIAKDPRNKDVLFPYLNGEELNSSPDHSPSRWVINFFDWPIEKARKYPDCFRIVEEKVRPERVANTYSKSAREKWWLYERSRPELYEAIAGMERVLVVAQVSRTLAFCLVPNQSVFTHKLVVFPFSEADYYAVLQSAFHCAWAWSYTSTLKADLSYTPTDCFETFSFPTSLNGLEIIGERYHAHRQQILLARQEGLTKTYNRFHDPDETSADIQKLRELHVEMDTAVAIAYGWSDIHLDHDFGVTKQGLRYTISELARREVLARLLKLNHERYKEEEKKGLHDKKKAKATSKPKITAVKPQPAKPTPTLLTAMFPGTELEKYLCGLVCDLVEADPGLTAAEYVDSLVIALGYKRYQQLLSGKDRTEFARLCKATPLASWTATDKIPWFEMKEHLRQRKAIEPEGQTIQAGSALSEVRKSYLPASPKLVTLLRKAAAELRDLQAQADPDKAELLQAFADDKEQWYEVAA